MSEFIDHERFCVAVKEGVDKINLVYSKLWIDIRASLLTTKVIPEFDRFSFTLEPWSLNIVQTGILHEEIIKTA